MRRSRDLTLLVLVWLLASVSVAQQDPCLRRIVTVNVMTQDGNLVWGLQARDFKAQLGRQSVEIVSATDDTDEHRVVIVLDASGSMSDKWKPAVTLAESLLKSTPRSAFALLTFSNQIGERVGFNQGKGAVAAKLARLENSPPSGKTALFDALHEALVLLTPPQLGDAIYVISDGGWDNRSRLTESKVKEELVASRVRLFAFVPMEPLENRGRTPEEAGGPGFLQGLNKESGGDSIFYDGYLDARTTRGAAVKLPARNPIGGVVTYAARAFGGEISEFYRLEIKLPALLDKPHSWKLEMAKPKGTKGRSLILIYPERLVPCEPPGD
jgi:hypothetical protein